MAARAIGSGTISFGLVNIPVKLYAAAESAAQISFHQLHDKCKSRIKQQLWCPVDEEIVTREHLVKGYEFARDQYVIFTAEELKALEEASTKAMEITEFVPLSKRGPALLRERLVPRARTRVRTGRTSCSPRPWSRPSMRRSPSTPPAGERSWC